MNATIALALLGCVFVYYSAWVLLTVSKPPTAKHSKTKTQSHSRLSQPFIEPAHVLQSFFPDRYIALALPLFFVVLLIGVNLVFMGWVLLFDNHHSSSDNRQLQQRRTTTIKKR